MINLGDKVRDRITGYEGIVMSKCEYLNGCIQFGVQAKKTKEGKLPKIEWIDDIQLKVIAEKTKLKKDEVGGGMRNHPF